MNLLEGMSIEEKVGQLICGRLAWEDIENDIAAGRVGSAYGLLHQLGSSRAAAEYLNQLQSLAKYPLLFNGEQEQGNHLNFSGGTQFPPYMAIGATRSKELAYLFGKVNTLEGWAVGYNWISCPTVDVNINPDNPIINTRSLGEDPDLVTELGMETCRAIVEHKGLTCVCHFPGHGATSCDSHAQLPTVTRTEQELWEVELAPYRAAIPAGYMNGIMTAHVYYPAWEPEPGLPATLSHNVMTKLLRERLGFQGILSSDSLRMKAIADNYSIGEAAVRAFLAGCDVVLAMEIEETFSGLLEAVKSGRIPMSQLDASVSRILQVKEWMGIFDKRVVDVDAVDAIVGCPEHRAIAKRVARESVTLLRGWGMPLRADAATTVITSSLDDALADEVRKRNPAARVIVLTDSGSLAGVGDAENVIIGVSTSVQAYFEESVRVNPRLVELTNRLVNSGARIALLILGNPYVVADLPDADICLCTYGDCPDSVEAAVAAVYGEYKPTGRLPVSICGKYPLGFGL